MAYVAGVQAWHSVKKVPPIVHGGGGIGLSWAPGQFEDVLTATIETTSNPISVNKTFEVRNWEARCGLLFSRSRFAGRGQ